MCALAGAASDPCRVIAAATESMPIRACTAALADSAFTQRRIAETRALCTEMTAQLCAEFGPQSETCELVKTETMTLPRARCLDMKQRYPKVVADLRRREAPTRALTPEESSVIAAGDGPALGPQGAKVTIVAFSDFECPYCARSASLVRRIAQHYPHQVRFVFRQFPLASHPAARGAAEASLAAHAQGKFWPLHDRLFADQRRLDRASLEQAARDIGLDLAAFRRALDQATFAAAVDADRKLGEALGITATPSMFLNGERVRDPTDFEGLVRRIDAVLSGDPAASASARADSSRGSAR